MCLTYCSDSLSHKHTRVVTETSSSLLTSVPCFPLDSFLFPEVWSSSFRWHFQRFSLVNIYPAEVIGNQLAFYLFSFSGNIWIGECFFLEVFGTCGQYLNTSPAAFCFSQAPAVIRSVSQLLFAVCSSACVRVLSAFPGEPRLPALHGQALHRPKVCPSGKLHLFWILVKGIFQNKDEKNEWIKYANNWF